MRYSTIVPVAITVALAGGPALAQRSRTTTPSRPSNTTRTPQVAPPNQVFQNRFVTPPGAPGQPFVFPQQTPGFNQQQFPSGQQQFPFQQQVNPQGQPLPFQQQPFQFIPGQGFVPATPGTLSPFGNVFGTPPTAVSPSIQYTPGLGGYYYPGYAGGGYPGYGYPGYGYPGYGYPGNAAFGNQGFVPGGSGTFLPQSGPFFQPGAPVNPYAAAPGSGARAGNGARGSGSGAGGAGAAAPSEAQQARLAVRAEELMADRPFREGTVVRIAGAKIDVRIRLDGEVRTVTYPATEVFFFHTEGSLAAADAVPQAVKIGSRVLVPEPERDQPASAVAGSREDTPAATENGTAPPAARPAAPPQKKTTTKPAAKRSTPRRSNRRR